MGINNPNILLIGYNRSNFIQKNLNHLDDLGFKNIFINIDGPKNEKDRLEQEKIKSIVSNNNSIQKFTQRDKNYGIINSIPNVIDIFFSSSNENILVLEDDVILSKSSINFIKEHKHRLEEENDLFFISLNSPCDQFIKSTYYSDFPYIWGWYISKAKWIEYRDFKQKFILIKLLKKYFNQPLSFFYWSSIYALVKLKILKSWDYDLVFYILCTKKQVLVPKYNLTENIGFGDNSTHTKEGFKKKFVNYNFSNSEIRFDNDVVKNKDRNITKLENQIVFDVSLSGFIKKAFRKIRVI